MASVTTYRVARCPCCSGWTIVDVLRHRAVGTFPDIYDALRIADLANGHRCLPAGGDLLLCSECRVPLASVVAA